MVLEILIGVVLFGMLIAMFVETCISSSTSIKINKQKLKNLEAEYENILNRKVLRDSDGE